MIWEIFLGYGDLVKQEIQLTNQDNGKRQHVVKFAVERNWSLNTRDSAS